MPAEMTKQRKNQRFRRISSIPLANIVRTTDVGSGTLATRNPMMWPRPSGRCRCGPRRPGVSSPPTQEPPRSPRDEPSDGVVPFPHVATLVVGAVVAVRIRAVGSDIRQCHAGIADIIAVVIIRRSATPTCCRQRVALRRIEPVAADTRAVVRIVIGRLIPLVLAGNPDLGTGLTVMIPCRPVRAV